MPRRLLPLLASLALVAPAADAHGFVGHGADSAQLRPLRGPRTASPRNAGLIRVRRAHGGTWRARVDAAGVPVRVFGSGVAAPGAIADADRARGHAVAMLSRHIAWLAPGSTAADFRVVANRALRGVRSVSLQQVHRGLPVVGAYVYFAFKRDRLVMFGSRAIPHPRGASGVGGSALYPLVQPDESYRLHRVRSYTVDTVAPFGRWAIYEDVVTGKVVARRSLVFAGAGQVLFKVPDRGPTGSRGDYPASYAEVTVDGSGQTTDADGNVSWAGGAPAALTTEVDGTFVNVDNQAGADITGGFSLADGGSVTWDVSTTEFDDAQLSAFVHANRAKDAARVMDPGLTWLDGTLTVRVNAKGDCNAFSLGDALLFFRSGMFDGQPCQNPARIADIVLHEVGHSVHIAAIVPGMGDTNPALGEGLADYFAATILDDPALADGFIGVGPLRHLDPKTGEAVWPTDIDGDSHITGLIIGGALWDLRKALIAKLGASAGKTLADQLFYSVMQRAPDIPGSYAAVLLEDDDDGNLSNGTPNKCVIDAVFLAHGLGDAGAAGSLISNDGLAVSVRDLAVEPGCPTITGAELVWRLRGDSGAGTTIAMTQTGSEWNAAIPDQAGDTVVEYQVLLTSSIGATTAFPRNGAAPWYQVYVGTAEQIYCTDFETDVLAGDWTTEATRGTNNWEWGTPAGLSTDPAAAFSGTGVLGNDLATTGTYDSDSTNRVTSPVIDVSGFEVVRLQYRRWLTVEDARWDKGTIFVNDSQVWQNVGGPDAPHHLDVEWRFHDVDITAQAATGSVQVVFELLSDTNTEYGGWNIDDVCIVGYRPGAVDAGPTDASIGPDAGGDGGGDGCGCASGGSPSGTLFLVALALLGLSRRRARPCWLSGRG